MTVELIRAAANNKVENVRSLLARPDIDVNFCASNGNTPLYAACFSRHIEVIRMLLEHGARRDEKVLSMHEDHQLPQEIYKLLHPDDRTVRTKTEQEVQEKIEKYKQTHKFSIDKEDLITLGGEYLKTEKVAPTITRENVAQYIVSAIEHMTLDLLEASKILDVDSDARYRIDSRVPQMLCAISACAGFIKNTHSDNAQKLSNIDFESLALYIRSDQYNPNFISKLEPSTVMQLVIKALHSMLDNGELEAMRDSVAGLTPTSDLPILHALLGFLNDEYNAQYVEDRIKDCRDRGDLSSEQGRARILISFIEIGEALENASPRLQSLFDKTTVEHLLTIRNILAHPERSDHREMISEFLAGNTETFTIGGIQVSSRDLATHSRFLSGIIEIFDVGTINIRSLAEYCVGQYDTISKFLQQYNFTQTEETDRVNKLWQNISDHASEYTKTSKIKIPRSSSETEKDKIEKDYSDVIAKVERIKEDRIEQLNQKITKQFQDKNFNDNMKRKLKDAQKSFDETKQALDKYQCEYNTAKEKVEKDKTDKDKKLIKDYENTLKKNTLWQSYLQEMADIKQEINIQKQQAEQDRVAGINQFAVKLIDDFIHYSEQVQTLFPRLNDLQLHTPISEIQSVTSRGFSAHPDQPLLAFYQIMVGSLARTLIAMDDIVKIMSPELKDSLEKIIIVARGYLAHIGVREVEKAFSESMDRPNVFQDNSEKIIAAIETMKVVKHALINGFENFDAASADMKGNVSSDTEITEDKVTETSTQSDDETGQAEEELPADTHSANFSDSDVDAATQLAGAAAAES